MHGEDAEDETAIPTKVIFHSHLLFYLNFVPISHALRKSKGFNVPCLDSPVMHLLFMDDLNVYTKNAKHLGDTLRVVDRASCAVEMELGLRKCHARGQHLREIANKIYKSWDL